MNNRSPRNYLFVLLAAVALNACSVSKEARSMKQTIKGDWVLSVIGTEGITGVVKTKLFNEADFSCFIGSEWNFIANNSMGSYTLVDKQKICPEIKRYIRWSIYEPKDAAKELQFKRLTDKKDPMDDGNGYRFTVIQLDKNTMKLRSEITYAGQPAAIIYNFVRK
jgi:hypothetical protein